MMPKLVVLSGAGLSAPSGVSTFRDKDGLWTKHDLDQVCDIITWKDNRELVHSFYNGLRADLAKAKPTAGHAMVAGWKNIYPNRTTVLTQNVDDLLERAGCHGVVHLHGCLQDMHCTACGDRWNIGYTAWDPEKDRCPDCNSPKGVKPGVVFFRETAPKYASLYQAFRKLTEKDTVVIIGTSGQVVNVDFLVFDTPAFTILNNMEPSPYINEDHFDRVYHSSIEIAADEIDRLVRERMG